MSDPHLADTALALDALAAVLPADPQLKFDTHLALAGHYARAEGVTVADLSATMPHRTVAIGALSSELTPLAQAALGLAADYPDLAAMPTRTRKDLARRYLP